MSSESQDTFAYTLKRPVTIRNTSYSKLTLRRPLVRDLIAAERQPGDIAGSAALLAICSGVPFADFGYLDAEDYRALSKECSSRGFFDDSDSAAGSSPPSTPAPAGASASS